MSARLHRSDLLAHSAARAWYLLGLEPRRRRRCATTLLKRNQVYRLEDAAPGGGTVIAKRCSKVAGAVERVVYEEYLPQLPIVTADYLGWIQDPAGEDIWIFMREVAGERYSPRESVHRVYAARWIGALHARAQGIGRHPALPVVSPRRYLEHLRRARECIRIRSSNPLFTAQDVAILERALWQLDRIEGQWESLEALCAAGPQTLFHGDFIGKNTFVQSAGEPPGIVGFDWENAGWGSPAVDLAQFTRTVTKLGASPDLSTYWDVARDLWPEGDRSALERLATCGTVLRALAVLDWITPRLAYDWSRTELTSNLVAVADVTIALLRVELIV